MLKITTEEKFVEGRVVEYVREIKGAMKVKDIRKAIPGEFYFEDLKVNKELTEAFLNYLKLFKAYDDVKSSFLEKNEKVEFCIPISSDKEIEISTYINSTKFYLNVKLNFSLSEMEKKRLFAFGEVLHQFRLRQKEIEKNLKTNVYEI